MRLRAVSSVVLLALASVACTGPHSSLRVGVKEIDTDVLIGPPQPSVVPALPPASSPGPIGFPGFVQPPVIPGPQASPTPVPQACPQADPLAPIPHAVTASAQTPPVERSYRYRNHGVWTQGDTKGALPDIVTRTVRNVVKQAPGGGFTFDVATPQQGGIVTTTTYHVYPSQPRPSDPTPGIYLERTVSEIPNKDPLTFTPVPALEIMQFDAAPGVMWTARGVDPFSRIVESFDGKITGKRTVDACGTWVSAWTVEITNGSIESPLETTSFSATLAIAPQYGGISVVDKFSQSGTKHAQPGDAGVAETVDNTASIQEAPVYPT